MMVFRGKERVANFFGISRIIVFLLLINFRISLV